MLELDNACVHSVKVLLSYFREYSCTIICSGICQNYFVCVLIILVYTHIITGTHIYRERRVLNKMHLILNKKFSTFFLFSMPRALDGQIFNTVSTKKLFLIRNKLLVALNCFELWYIKIVNGIIGLSFEFVLYLSKDFRKSLWYNLFTFGVGNSMRIQMHIN